MSYEPSLDSEAYEGNINAVKVKWGDTAKVKLPKDAQNLGVSEATIKALTEHYLYACAVRIGCAHVTILGAPHTFTTNSATGGSKDDWDHVSGRLSDALPDGLAQKGRYRVHVYLADQGVGESAYDEITVKGERVIQMVNGGPDKLRADLSTGEYPDVD